MNDKYLTQSLNQNTMLRVTHRESGIHRTGVMYSGKPGVDQIAHMIDEIEEELKKTVSAVPFHVALQAVIEDGKGMHLDPESIGQKADLKPTFIVRANIPGDFDLMTLPHLYIETEVGTTPWSPDQCAMFASWRIID